VSAVVIANYDPEWPRLFEREAAAVLAGVEGVRRVEHVGSTAVPGLSARPTVDLLAGADDPSALDADALAALGYAEVEAARGPDRRLFGKGTPAFQTYELEAVRLDGERWRRRLALRDRLRSDLDLAERYAHRKRQLAREHGGDAAAYARAKAALVTALLLS
jgi:GrpB-like predicted nucleotidyltransferase (UPF0157 family)